MRLGLFSDQGGRCVAVSNLVRIDVVRRNVLKLRAPEAERLPRIMAATPGNCLGALCAPGGLPSAEALSDAADRVELIVVDTELADNVVRVAIADASAEGERAYEYRVDNRSSLVRVAVLQAGCEHRTMMTVEPS